MSKRKASKQNPAKKLNPSKVAHKSDGLFFTSNHNSFFSSQTIQPKLRISHPNDKYEQQADRVADAVMRMPDPAVQRQPEREEEKLQKKSEASTTSTSYASSEISSQLQSQKGSGSCLPGAVQSEMGNKIGADFSEVNIHTDSKAVQMNQQLGAKAFTHGNDVYFNRGQYNAASPSGKHLLAHELTHVVQQGNNNMIQPKKEAKSDKYARFQDYTERLYYMRFKDVGVITDGLLDASSKLGFNVSLQEVKNHLVAVISNYFPKKVQIGFLKKAVNRTSRKNRINQASFNATMKIGDVKSQPVKGMGGGFPVLGAIGSAAEEASTNLSNAAEAYFRALIKTMKSEISKEEQDSLEAKLLESTVLSSMFPVFFNAGAAVGIMKDVKDTLEGVIELLTNFQEILDLSLSIIAKLISDEGEKLGKILGEETGKIYSKEVSRLIGLGPIDFTFEMGKLVGPSIVYTALSLVFPALTLPRIFKRVMKFFNADTIKKFGRLLKKKKLTQKNNKQLNSAEVTKIVNERNNSSVSSSKELGEQLSEDPELKNLWSVAGPNADASTFEKRLRSAVGDALEAGFIEGPSSPGSVSFGIQPHRRASDVRKGFDVPGSEFESAHFNPTSALKYLENYVRDDANTLLLPKGTHKKFDDHWKKWAKNIDKKQVTVREFLLVMDDAIMNVETLNRKTKNQISSYFLYELLIQMNLSLEDKVRVPYS